MQTPSPYDLAFVGGGPAALLAAGELLRVRPAARLAIVDASPPEEDQRTFGTWWRGRSPFDDAAFATWDRLFVFGPHGREVVQLGDWRYLAFTMGDWRERRRDELVDAGVAWVDDVVRSVEQDEDGAVLRLDGRSLHADFVLDSRCPGDLDDPDGLVQSFRGWWVRTASPAFDVLAATWMDFRDSPPDAPRFWYRLPLSHTHALLMAVTYAPRPHKAELEPYLRILGLDPADVTVERIEAGCLPLRPGPWPRRIGGRILKIGRAGGRLRASTGYGLNRMVADATAIAESVQRHDHPFALPEERWHTQRMDAIFLEALRAHPDRVAEWMEGMASQLPISRLLRFLDGSGTWLDHAAVASVLPIRDFAPHLL